MGQRRIQHKHQIHHGKSTKRALSASRQHPIFPARLDPSAPPLAFNPLMLLSTPTEEYTCLPYEPPVLEKPPSDRPEFATVPMERTGVSPRGEGGCSRLPRYARGGIADCREATSHPRIRNGRAETPATGRHSVPTLSPIPVWVFSREGCHGAILEFDGPPGLALELHWFPRREGALAWWAFETGGRLGMTVVGKA